MQGKKHIDFEFDPELYKLQQESYDEECEPHLHRPPRRKINVRLKTPRALNIKGDGRVMASTGMDTEEAALTIRRGSKASPKDQVVHKFYNDFDEQLGILRDVTDPFTAIIELGRRRFLDPNVQTPEFDRYKSVIDWALDGNNYNVVTSNRDKDDSYYAWLENLEKNPDYKPKIFTKFNQDLTFQQQLYDEEMYRSEGVRNLNMSNNDIYEEVVTNVYEDAIQKGLIDIYEEDDGEREPHYWDYLRWNFHLVWREATLEIADNINGYHWYLIDIYEANHKRMNGKQFLENFNRIAAITDYFFAFNGNETAMSDLFPLLDPKAEVNYDGRYKGDRPEAEWLVNLIDRYKAFARDERRTNPLPIYLQDPEELEAAAKRKATKKRKPKVVVPPPNRNNCPTVLDLLPQYMNAEKWRDKSNKGRNAEEGLLKRATGILSHHHGYIKPIDQLLPRDANLIAQTLEEGVTVHTWLKDIGVQGGRSESGMISNSTIREYVGSVRLFLDWARGETKEDAVTVDDVWIDRNVFSGVSLDNYGEEERQYEALTDDQLYAFFDQEMSETEFLIFKLLITTGLRLDECILLTWESYQLDRNGHRYFDLSLVNTKNDKYSNRNVAIPDIIELEYDPYDSSQRAVITGNEGKGRLFDYPLDSDGKSSKWASKELNKKFMHPVRYSKEKYDKPRTVHNKPTGELLPDNKKVLHSFRNNLSGLMGRLKPYPSSEVMDWITGHGMKDTETASVRRQRYQDAMDVGALYDVVNRVEHPWLDKTKRKEELQKYPFEYNGWVKEQTSE